MIGNALVSIVAFATMCAYVCRLDALTWRAYRSSFVLLHVAHLAVSAWVMTQALGGQQTVGGLLALAGAIEWLWISFPTWKNGPPAHSRRVSAPS